MLIRSSSATCEIFLDCGSRDSSIPQFHCLAALAQGFVGFGGSRCSQAAAWVWDRFVKNLCSPPTPYPSGQWHLRCCTPASDGRIWHVGGAPAGGVPPGLAVFWGAGPGALTSLPGLAFAAFLFWLRGPAPVGSRVTVAVAGSAPRTRRRRLGADEPGRPELWPARSRGRHESEAGAAR